MSMTSGQPSGPDGSPFGAAPQDSPPSRKRAWPRRHPVWSSLIAIVILLVIIGAVAGSPSTKPSHSTAASASPTPTSTATAAATPTPPPLTSSASVTRKHPVIGTKVGVLVSTMPNARITVVAHFPAGNREKTSRADASGLHTFWFRPAGPTLGYRVKVDVRVYAHGQKRSSRTWFTPRQRPAPPPPPSAAPAPPTSAAPAPSTSAPAPSGCYPKTSSGHCYEPGEFCPHADTGMSGVAGDGEAIICEDNNGLRWEPA
jgi:hypothetical protein